MTSLIAWVGVDTHGPASLYIASDSRISWGAPETWDYGRKVFACSRSSADIFGYCGDVVFPSLLLGQLSALADANLLFRTQQVPEERHAGVLNIAKRSLAAYPARHRGGFSILHGSRTHEGSRSSFRLWRTDWSATSDWRDVEVALPSKSGLIVSLGSGEQSVEKHNLRWHRSDVGGTSRAVFTAFCDSLASGKDPRSGGAPQLVGLYRSNKYTAENIGVIYGGRRWLLGVPIGDEAQVEAVEWRNELFERCEGGSKARLAGAQAHARPAL